MLVTQFEVTELWFLLLRNVKLMEALLVPPSCGTIDSVSILRATEHSIRTTWDTLRDRVIVS